MQHANAVAGTAGAGCRRVMVIDDDVDYLQALQRVFADRPDRFQVEVRDDAWGAVRALSTRPVDLVLMDRYLPGLDGIELCRHLRTRLPWMTVVISSYHVTSEVRWAALRAGASRVLPKPVTPEHLEATLDEALRAVESARGALISSHFDVAQTIAASMSRRYWQLISPDEIETLAAIGLCEAAARFDPFRNQPFAAFARVRIRGAIIDGVRNILAQTRSRHARRKQYASVRRALAAAGLGDLATQQMADLLGIDVEDVLESEVPNRVVFQPLETEPVAEDLGPNALVEEHEVLRAVRAARQTLSAIEASILSEHYDQGQSIDDIARARGMSWRRVEQIHTRALAKLRRIVDAPS